MTEPKEALKPCPFCGFEATTMDMETYRSTPSWSAFCNHEPCRFEGGFGGYSTEAKAIAAWNTRADDAENALLREKLAEREALLRECREQINDASTAVKHLAWRRNLGRLVDKIGALTGGDNAEG